MNTADIEALKVVLYDFATSGKADGHKKSRWDCLQFSVRAIQGGSIPKEIIEYINQIYHQTSLIKS